MGDLSCYSCFERQQIGHQLLVSPMQLRSRSWILHANCCYLEMVANDLLQLLQALDGGLTGSACTAGLTG